MNPGHYVRIKKEVNCEREGPAIIYPDIIVIDSEDDDTITYASSSRSFSPDTSNTINNDVGVNRTHDIIEITDRDDNKIDLIDVENIIADNKLIIERYKEANKGKVVNKHNVINDVIIKDEFPTTSNTEFLNIKNKQRERRNETINRLNVPSSVQDEIIIIEDKVISDVLSNSKHTNRASIIQSSKEVVSRRNCASHQVIDLPSPTTCNEEENLGIICPVCLTLLSGNQIASTICGHIFCMDCIQSVLSSNNKKCPTCRKKLTKKGYHQIYI